jgi:hypothetical protein
MTGIKQKNRSECVGTVFFNKVKNIFLLLRLGFLPLALQGELPVLNF